MYCFLFSGSLSTTPVNTSKYGGESDSTAVRKSKLEQTPSKSSRNSKTPAKRRSSGRQRTSTVKTPIRKTPASVKRLGRPKQSSTTPGKVAAALTALKLTPVHKVTITPATAKRGRKDGNEPTESSPAKRARVTPKTAVASATNLEVSPPALNVDGLLKQAIKTLNDSSRKAKRNVTGQLVSVIDGIEVPCLPDKEHSMETRADKAARDPPIQLRSRSVVKVSLDKRDAPSKPFVGPHIRSQSSERASQPVKGQGARSRSIDRLLNPTKASKAPEPFISLKEATLRFQNRTPLRFRAKRRNSPGKLVAPLLTYCSWLNLIQSNFKK